MVLTDGSFVTASADQNADLFWGLRGGGGNFGIVTSFVFRLYPVTTVVAGMVVYPIARARAVLAVHREMAESAPDQLAVFTSLGTTPTGTPIIALIVCFNGPAEAAERLLRPIRALGPGLLDTIAEQPYWQFNRSVDDRHPHYLRYYWKTSLARELSEAATDAATEYFTRTPNPLGFFTIEQYGGAVSRVRPDESAFPHRDAQFNVITWAKWSDPAEDDARIGWARGMWQTMQQYVDSAVYMNMLGGESEGADRVRAAYGPNYARLAALKAGYDPTNFFRRNQNVVPSREAHH